MVDKELIEIWRNMMKPSISSRLFKTKYEGKGEQDKEEFERDFDEILDLALIGLKHKAQLSLEDATISTCSVACSTQDDTISREDALLCLTGIISDMTIKDYIVMVSKRIRNLPPAQSERKTGYWIGIDDEPCDVYKCDQCGTTYDTADNTWDLPYFCPNCGAKMVEK